MTMLIFSHHKSTHLQPSIAFLQHFAHVVLAIGTNLPCLPQLLDLGDNSA